MNSRTTTSGSFMLAITMIAFVFVGCGEIPTPLPVAPASPKKSAESRRRDPPASSPSASASTVEEGPKDQEQRDWADLNAKAFGFCGGDIDFEAFLSRYPWTRFKDEADRRIADLKKQCSDHLQMIPEAQPEPTVAEKRSAVRTLFARCASNKAKMAALNQKRLAAARAGDDAGAKDAFRKLGALQPEVTETLASLNAAIFDLTDGKEPEMSKMRGRIKTECW